MLVLVAIVAISLGVYELTRRYLWGPWPRFIRAIHAGGSYQDYEKVALPAAMDAVLGKHPDISPELAIPELIAVLDDPKDLPRIAAMTALALAGPSADQAVPRLILLLRAPSNVQLHAAHALGEIVTSRSPHYDAAITALIAAKRDAYAQTPAGVLCRVYVIQAVTRIVGEASERRADLATLLASSLNDHDSQIRATAALGLIKLGRAKEAGPVLSAIRSGEPGYEGAQLGLGLLGSSTNGAVAALRTYARVGTDPWIKKAAARAVGFSSD